MRRKNKKTKKTQRTKAQNTLHDTAEEVQEKFIYLRDNVSKYTKKNPLKSAGLALLAGVVLSRVFRRK